MSPRLAPRGAIRFPAPLVLLLVARDAASRAGRARWGETGRGSGLHVRSEALNSIEMDALDDAEPKLSGQSVLDTRWAFEQVIGPDAMQRARATVKASAREVYEAATALTWVPYSAIRLVHDAYAREAGRDVDELLAEVVPLSAERSLTTVWRPLLRSTTDDALLSRLASMYARSRSRGTMSGSMVGLGAAIVEVTDWASLPERDVQPIALSIAAYLRLTGREAATVHATRTASGVQFRMSWRI